MSDQTNLSAAAAAEPGRLTALVVYGLYLLSIPSLAVFALIGAIIAYVGRDGAGPISLSHMNDQIRVFWVAFWWAVAIIIATIIGWLLTIVLIGFPILWLAGIVGFIVMIWFTVKSVLGLLKLLDGRSA